MFPPEVLRSMWPAFQNPPRSGWWVLVWPSLVSGTIGSGWPIGMFKFSANVALPRIPAILSGFMWLVCCMDLYGQGAAKYHVFPQFVDGAFPDGSFFRSTLFAINAATANASCNYQLHGMSNDRLGPANTITLPANGGVFRASTTGNAAAIAAGYSTLSCDQPTFSYVQYEYVSSDGAVQGTASVYSSPSGTASEFIFPTAPGYRLGVAVANDSDNSSQITLRLGAAGANELQTTIMLQPRSRTARFVDELFTIPNGFVPVALLLQSAGPAPTPFNALGLTFSGPVFSTAPPLVYQPQQ
jgi:hypothetical protein